MKEIIICVALCMFLEGELVEHTYKGLNVRMPKSEEGCREKYSARARSI